MQGSEGVTEGLSPAREAVGGPEFPAALADLEPPSGVIVWLGELPDHSVVVDGSNSDLPGATDVVLSVRPLPPNIAPEPPDDVAPWLPDLSDPDTTPAALPAIAASGAGEPGELPPPPLLLSDHPRAADAVAEWLPFWHLWALAERQDRPARDLHARLEEAARLLNASESGVEIVLGLGLLSWDPSDGQAMHRHLLTAGVRAEQDGVTGEVRLLSTGSGVRLELEMLDGIELHAPDAVAEVRAWAASYDGAATARRDVEAKVRELAVALAADGDYRPGHERPVPGTAPVVTWAPALILRRPQNVIDLRIPAVPVVVAAPEPSGGAIDDSNRFADLPPPPAPAVVNRMQDLADDARTAQVDRPVTVDLDPALAEEERLLDTLQALRRERAMTRDELTRVRSVDAPPALLPYAGSRARIADRLAAEANDFAWIASARVAPGSSPPISDAHMQHWVMLRSDDQVRLDEPDAMGELLSVERMPSVEAFRAVVDEEERAHAAADDHGPPTGTVGRALLDMSAGSIAAVRSNVVEISSGLEGLHVGGRGWTRSALRDVRAGTTEAWINRRVSVTALVTQAEEQLRAVGVDDVIDCSGSPGDLITPAVLLLEWLQDGNTVRVGDDGRPRARMRIPKPVVDSAAVLERVRVNGVPPVDAAQLRSFIAWARASIVVDQLERLWPDPEPSPPVGERSLRYRLDKQRESLAQLDRILTLGDRMALLDRQVEDLGAPPVAWDTPASVGDLLEELDRAAAHLRADAASDLVIKGERRVAPFLELDDPPDWALAFSRAVRTRDVGAFAAVRDRLMYLDGVRENLRWCAGVEGRLRPALGSMVDSVRDPDVSTDWAGRAQQFGAAWRWAGAKAWLEQGEADINRIIDELRIADGRIRDTLERLWDLVGDRVEGDD